MNNCMKLLLEFNSVKNNKTLNYITNEYSFDMEPSIQEANFAILINNIELTVDKNDFIVQVSGFCPHTTWIKSNYHIQNYKNGKIKVLNTLKSGFSYRINKNELPVYFNDKEGWICVGNPDKLGQGIEFINCCVAIVEQGELISLWLKPRILGQLLLQ